VALRLGPSTPSTRCMPSARWPIFGLRASDPAMESAVEAVLWRRGPECARKVCLFGIGRKFRWLKYPFVWYDILHVTDVLSRFPFVRADARSREMVGTITAQADEEGLYTTGSMYMAWKGWSFANKKIPSPWLTFLVLRLRKRVD
jgi:hypothetical protein